MPFVDAPRSGTLRSGPFRHTLSQLPAWKRRLSSSQFDARTFFHGFIGRLRQGCCILLTATILVITAIIYAVVFHHTASLRVALA